MGNTQAPPTRPQPRNTITPPNYPCPGAPKKQPINSDEAARRYGGIVITEYGTTTNNPTVNRRS
ncbi:hypothetical protein RchiOBHm_Chr4g0423481 [Rosa chinensis]|uniref:Uncharacterized protein n=1 Tax=Rosa chinensis TaxID=74649 RepID=A0A2P6QYN4_ROSCH|nr:hypothetical protein RchiOBHm_Chr4g0423481 [Rosa chinensis]